MNNGRKYSSSIYDDVKDFFEENYKEQITESEIDEMDRGDVLDCYLNWNGIFGYGSMIKKILGYYDCKLVELEEVK